MLLKGSAPPPSTVQPNETLAFTDAGVIQEPNEPPAWLQRLQEMRTEQDWDSAGLVAALRENTVDDLRSDERMQGMFYAWETGESVPSPYYRGLLGKVFDVDPAQFATGDASDGDVPAPRVNRDGDVVDPYLVGTPRPAWAKQVRAARREQGMGKAELAAALREQADQPLASEEELFLRVSLWENAKAEPSVYFQGLLGEVFGADPAQFDPNAPAADKADAVDDPATDEPAAEIPPWAQRVTDLRSEQGMSTGDLTGVLREQSHLTLASDEDLYIRVARWESGKSVPSRYFRHLLGEVFDVPVSQFNDPETGLPPAGHVDEAADDSAHRDGTSAAEARVPCLDDSDEDGWDC